MVSIKTLLNFLAILVAMLGTASVLGYLDAAVLGLFLVALVVGAWSDRRERYWLNGTAATTLAVVGILFYAVQISKADVATPVVHALVLLLSVRLLAEKQGRDYLQIFVLSIFILAGSSLLDLGLGFIVYLVLIVFFVIFGLVLLTVYATDKRLALPRRDLLKLMRVALIMPIVSLVLMLVFFLVLPRTRHPLWNFLNPAGQAVVGLSETVRPGSYAQISEVKQLAFRAETPELRPDQLYWRALVLNQPEGTQWVRQEPPDETVNFARGAGPFEIMVYPEPRSDRYVVTLGQPLYISGIRYHKFSDRVYRATTKIDQRYRYRMKTRLEAVNSLKNSADSAFYLTLPDHVSPRVMAVAERIRASSPDVAASLTALERFFLSQDLNYAMDDLPGGADPIDDFLFNKKRGYCEFFASSYTVLARLVGVPARMVGGYYGGQYNRLGGYYSVSGETAHVWVEVLDNNRWQRVDPSQWAINAATTLGDRRVGLSAWQGLVDALDYYWIQAVVVFDFYRQFEFFRSMRESIRGGRPDNIEIDSRWVAGLLVSLLAAFGFWAVRHRPSQRERLIDELRVRIRRRYGAESVPESLGLEELAERLDDDRCREFARIYQGAVFRDRPLRADEIRRLKALLKDV